MKKGNQKDGNLTHHQETPPCWRQQPANKSLPRLYICPSVESQPHGSYEVPHTRTIGGCYECNREGIVHRQKACRHVVLPYLHGVTQTERGGLWLNVKMLCRADHFDLLWRDSDSTVFYKNRNQMKMVIIILFFLLQNDNDKKKRKKRKSLRQDCSASISLCCVGLILSKSLWEAFQSSQTLQSWLFIRGSLD